MRAVVAAVVAAAAAVAGCVESQVTVCANGATCPAGNACVTDLLGTRCVAQAQVDACRGAAAGDACAVPAEGACFTLPEALVCLPLGCGNGVVEEGEQCEDGNSASGDGCAADCRSDERCGNGVVDLVLGEACDDGDLRSHDGCASTCRAEELRVTSPVRDLPGPRAGLAASFDARRGRLVAFGGVGPLQRSARLGEYDGGWTVAPTNGRWPAGRGYAASAYDELRGEVVVFGGDQVGGVIADAWAWNGSAWRSIDAAGPPAQVSAAMAYDAAAGEVVLVSVDPSDLTRSTWLLRDDTWTRLAGAELPSDVARGLRAALAFDRARGRLVAVLGTAVFERAAGGWMRGPDAPALAGFRALAFEPASQRLVLVGHTGDGVLRTYAWTGGAWEAQGGATISAPDGQLVADTVRGGLLFLRGDTNGTALARRDATGWVPVAPGAPLPDGLVGTAGALDAVRGEIVLFGGAVYGEAGRPGTFTFDGRAWREVAGTSPSPRRWHAMAADPVRGRIVMFGGFSDLDEYLGDTWEWDGATWSRATPPQAPSARHGHGLAYDPARGRVVLFGGHDATGWLGDTWAWDGTTWAPIPSGEAPRAREAASLAHDPLGGGLLLFGGGTRNSPEDDWNEVLGDTWRLTATGWQQVVVPGAPGKRAAAGLTWDPVRARLVLTGGDAPIVDPEDQVLLALRDAWEWDGARWREVQVTPSMRQRSGHAAVLHPGGAGVVLAGGIIDTVTLPEVQTLRWDGAAPAETCVGRVDVDGDGRTGCADDDCWAVCRPLCPPEVPGCVEEPACGDGVAGPRETPQLCPADVGAPPVLCGDLVCDPGEACAGDCP